MSAEVDRPPLRRNEIIAEARTLVVEGGLEALSLRRLATRFGVTAPALYGYVTDKHDLLRALAESEYDRLLLRFAEVTTTDPLERIRQYNRAYVAHSRENPEMFGVMFLFPPDLTGASGLPAEVELPGASRAFGVAADAVVAAIDAGVLHSDDPLLVALALWSSVHGVASVLQLGFALPADFEQALVDEVIERMLDAYRT